MRKVAAIIDGLATRIEAVKSADATVFQDAKFMSDAEQFNAQMNLGAIWLVWVDEAKNDEVAAHSKVHDHVMYAALGRQFVGSVGVGQSTSFAQVLGEVTDVWIALEDDPGFRDDGVFDAGQLAALAGCYVTSLDVTGLGGTVPMEEGVRRRIHLPVIKIGINYDSNC